MQTSINVDRVVSELRESLRLRLGIFLVLVIVMVWISLALGDIREGQQRAIDLALSELMDVRSVADESFWQGQLDQQVTTAQKAGVKVWQDRSPSRLAANLQSKLYAMAGETRILAPEIRTSSHERVFRDQELYRLKASIRGYYRRSDAIAFLDKIESHSPAIAVDSMSMKTTPNKKVNNRFDLIVVVYFQTDGGS